MPPHRVLTDLAAISSVSASGTDINIPNLDIIANSIGTDASSGIGYSTGAGGAVTQASSRSTGVTLNAICGAITMNGASLAAGEDATFVVTNSTVAATDVVIACLKTVATPTTPVMIGVTAIAAGSFSITITNLHATTATTDAHVINFAVIKAVAA